MNENTMAGLACCAAFLLGACSGSNFAGTSSGDGAVGGGQATPKLSPAAQLRALP